jgi:hypothetical protein
MHSFFTHTSHSFDFTRNLKKLQYCILGILCFSFTVELMAQQDSLVEKFELPEAVKETSGLMFFNNRVITHNDSGDGPNLYEIDTVTGTITRTVTISNATNVDWEDIDQDDTFMYVADIGNNSGNRQDLKIYKILKSDYVSSTSITAEVISFSYEDQTDFTSQPNNTNFDAEAIAIYQDNIVIFTKNWIDFQTNVYVIPKTVGTHSAQKVSNYDSQGLITGASINGEHFLLTGYDSSAFPFLVFLNENRPPGLDFFGGGNEIRIPLVGDVFLEQGSQIEGVCHLTFDRWYISREFSSTTAGGMTFEFPQKLYEFTSFVFFLLSTQDEELSKTVQIIPNPVDNFFSVYQQNNPQEIQQISIYNNRGQEMKLFQDSIGINIEDLASGIYFAKIQFASGKQVVKQLLKK